MDLKSIVKLLVHLLLRNEFKFSQFMFLKLCFVYSNQQSHNSLYSPKGITSLPPIFFIANKRLWYKWCPCSNDNAVQREHNGKAFITIPKRKMFGQFLIF
jgi:hypothetical protein